MREIRTYGSEGGGAEANRLFLPLSRGKLLTPARVLASFLTQVITPRSDEP